MNTKHAWVVGTEYVDQEEKEEQDVKEKEKLRKITAIRRRSEKKVGRKGKKKIQN